MTVRSAVQIDTASRGFSFAQDGPLDMRMGPSVLHSAEDIVNTWSEHELGRIFREWGEERAWRRLAGKIVQVMFAPEQHHNSHTQNIEAGQISQILVDMVQHLMGA